MVSVRHAETAKRATSSSPRRKRCDRDAERFFQFWHEKETDAAPPGQAIVDAIRIPRLAPWARRCRPPRRAESRRAALT